MISAHPRDAAGRQAIRDAMITAAVTRARLEALDWGISMKCQGTARPALTEKTPWHATEPGGCANDGSTCICFCHDQPAEPVEA